MIGIPPDVRGYVIFCHFKVDIGNLFRLGIMSEFGQDKHWVSFLLVFGLSRIIYAIMHVERSLMNPQRNASCEVGSVCNVIILDFCRDLYRGIVWAILGQG